MPHFALVALFVPSLVLASLVGQAPAGAAGADEGPVRLAQVELELYVDEYGRRWLVDPYTGEIVARAPRRERMRRSERIRRDRRAMRERGRNRRARRLDEVLGLRDPYLDDDGYDRGRFEDDFFDNRPRDGRGRYLDEFEDDRWPREERRRERQPVERMPQPPVDDDSEVARLPDPEPVPNSRTVFNVPKPKYGREKMAQLQVVLDRSGFSPGVIDGQWGTNVAKAMQAYKEAKGSADVLADARSLDKLMATTGGQAFATYTITRDDVRGPYVPNIPIDYARKAQMKRLAFTSVEEMLAERFHMSEAYLRALNDDKDFRRVGTVIKVVAPGPRVGAKVHYIVADKGAEQLRAYDRNGKLVVAYPATIGSASTPSPSGTHKVERIAFDPEYTYNPKINFQQGSNDKILTIPPGPNGPVGSIWIALSKPTYGIHGTPNPEKIGKTNSHGCIRLTNWDAQELAKLVSEGVTVEFK